MRLSSADPVKVAMVVPSLRGGGLERLARDLVLALDRAVFEPAVFCLNGLGVFAEDLEAAGVPVHDCRERGARVRGLPLRLIRALSDFGPDLIHAHSGTWYSAAVSKALLRRPGLVFTDHGRYPPEPRSRAVVERWCHRRTDNFVAVSAALADYVRDFLDLDATPDVVENGVDLAAYTSNPHDRQRLRHEWGFGSEEIALITIGRFAPVKNHRGLLESFARSEKEAPKLRLVLAGTGPLEDEVRAQAAALGVEGKVRFLGFRNDVAACLNAADALVIASSTEALPVSLLEALAAGKPVVSTAVGGIPAALGDPPAGILVDPGDPAQLAAALIRMGTEPDVRNRLAARAEEQAQQFSLTSFAGRYTDIYLDIIQKQVIR